MKVETIRTTTLYVILAANELTLVEPNSWQELPQLPRDLILRTVPNPGLEHTMAREREGLAQQTHPLQVLARVQLRADYLSGLDLHPVGEEALEMYVPPEKIADVNRNLVGPVVPLQDCPADEIWTVHTLAARHPAAAAL